MKTEPKEFNDLIKCWQSLPKDDGQLPLKTQFRPSKIRRLMPHLFLLELSNEKRIHVRLMGSEVENSLDRATPKDTVFDTLLSKDWRFYDRFMKACGGATCAGRFSRSVERQDGMTVKLDSLGVPLADKDGTARYMLGVIVAKENPLDDAISIAPVSFEAEETAHEFVDLGNGIPGEIEPRAKRAAGSPRVTN